MYSSLLLYDRYDLNLEVRNRISGDKTTITENKIQKSGQGAGHGDDKGKVTRDGGSGYPERGY